MLRRAMKERMWRGRDGAAAAAQARPSVPFAGYVARDADVRAFQRAIGNRATVDRLRQSPSGERHAPGRPLSSRHRARFEPVFGDLSHVRIHDDARGDEIAAHENAAAATDGADIYFRRGFFQPHLPAGLGLLAHELT